MLDKLNVKNLPYTIHIDNYIFKHIDNKFSYFKPLVVQAFPDTKNRKTWCNYCNDSNILISFLDKLMMNKFYNILHQLNLEKENFGALVLVGILYILL